MIDRRRFLRTAALGLATIPLAEFLAACGEGAATATTAESAARSAVATTIPHPTAEVTAPPPETTDTLEPAPPPTSALASATVGAICRDAWRAKPAASSLVPHTIERLTVHHTAAVLGDNSQAPGRLRGHQAYHQSLGWPDLAYHVAVDANGNIYAARPTDAKGDTATNYDPAGHFLVVAEGDFNSQDIPQAQLDGVATVLAWAATEFTADPATIRGHRDWAATSCPGENFYPLIADGTLEAMVTRRIADGGVDLQVVCDDSAFAAVAAIEAGEVPPVLAAPARFYLRDTNSAGNADRIIELGNSDWVPVAGDFGE